MTVRTAAVLRLLILLPVVAMIEVPARPGEIAADPVDSGAAPATIGRDAPVLPGEIEIRALHLAYPERIRSREIRWDEWAFKMDDRWYYWAEGRLLPVEYRLRPDQFDPIRFYDNYQRGPIRLREVDEELASRLRDRTQQNLGSGDEGIRYNGFLDDLYQVRTREEAEARMVRTRFFGMGVRVHPIVRKPLENAEQRVRLAMQDDSELRDFVHGLRQVHGYNWRNIAGTQRRSYHSYGVAVDFVPASYGGRFAYWRWAAEAGITDWWALPLEDRWMVPQAFVEAFEAEGFVWGGKWLFFDMIHFEYRPETFLLLSDEEEFSY